MTPASIATLDHAEHRRRQQSILDAVLHVCATDANVLGVTATGSYARGQNDAFSDLDVDVYFTDEARTGASDLHQRVSGVARTLSVLYLYDQNGLYLFENGVRLDLTYKRLDEVQTDAAANVRILHDPHGILALELGTRHTATQPNHPRYFQVGDPAYVRWFLWMCRQLYGWTKRAAQGDHRAFDKLFDAGASLQLIRSSLLDMRRWTLGATDYFGVADPETAAELRETYCRLVPAEMQDATRRLLAIYERICPAYCVKAGTTYPADDVIALRRVLDEFDALA